jgi:2-polyprenyl-6-methoxyphenol hydroxylase-like FAD-dependent oxidoreductase
MSPDNLLVVGDAIASFNPVYGQGMSSAALQIKALAEILDSRAAESRGLEGLAPEFFRKAAEVIDTPWALAANSDFAYPQTEGERPKGRQEDASYFAALDSLLSEDIEVQRLVVEVFQLTKPLQMLSEEPLRSRVHQQQCELGYRKKAGLRAEHGK